MNYDVIVVGGGPVGCAVARDIAAAGYRVLVLEEHQEIGAPVQCAGLISKRALEISRVPSMVVLNRLNGTVVYAPGESILRLEGRKVYALVIDRLAFDRFLAEQARGAGAEILCDVRAVNFTYIPGGILVETKNRAGESGFFSGRLLIGADGNNSAVARWLGLHRPLEKVFLYAAEAEVREPEQNSRMAHIFLDRCLAPGWFGWIFPVGNNRARVGVGCSPLVGESREESPRLLFSRLVNRYPLLFREMKVLQNTSGVVPIGFLRQTFAAHVLLVGDAAAHTKPVSGGGLYFGLKAGEHCADTAIKALQAQNFSPEFLSAYQKKWEAAVGQEIYCGLKLRELFLKMKNEEIELLLAFFNKPIWRKLILKYGDLDYHSRLAARLALALPWVGRFLTDGLRNLIQEK
ncbi:MAG: geranylgeranyl reductase family protein [Peptococcaceae bacterium]